jgi:hypothetical protein
MATSTVIIFRISHEFTPSLARLRRRQVTYVSCAIVQYGPSSMIFSSSLFSVLNRGYGVTFADNNIYSVFKFIGGLAGIFPKGILLP